MLKIRDPKFKNNSPQPATLGWAALGATNFLPHVCVLLFSFSLGLNFISFCFKLIIIYYHTQTQREIKFEPRWKNKIDNIIHDTLKISHYAPECWSHNKKFLFAHIMNPAYLVKMTGNWLLFCIVDFDCISANKNLTISASCLVFFHTRGSKA